MKPIPITTSWLLLASAFFVAAIFAFVTSRTVPEGPRVDVNVPVRLSPEAASGKALFMANCQRCHGANGAGSDQGPPLVHKIYEPGHHGDISFQRAAEFGVKAHHWRFGDMPPVPGISADQVALVVRYVRELQRANGIR